MKGWEIAGAKVVLPEGFSLREEEDLLHLLYRGEEVRVLSYLRATPAAIEKAAEEHLRTLQVKPGQ